MHHFQVFYFDHLGRE